MVIKISINYMCRLINIIYINKCCIKYSYKHRGIHINVKVVKYTIAQVSDK